MLHLKKIYRIFEIQKILDVGKILKKRDVKFIFSTLILKNYQKSFQLIDHLKFNYYDAIIIGVKHKKFKDLGLRRIRKFAKKE